MSYELYYDLRIKNLCYKNKGCWLLLKYHKYGIFSELAFLLSGLSSVFAATLRYFGVVFYVGRGVGTAASVHGAGKAHKKPQQRFKACWG
jgi:hypothetical protein